MQMLYNQFRPNSFSKMCGQDVSKQILVNQILQGKVSHSYIFQGLHGSGKTTSARIFSQTLNCEHPINGEPCNQCESCREFLEDRNMDYFEIDAASNNKVDDISRIKEGLAYPPRRKYKIYVFDEAHMLTKQAWASFLKTLEDCPKNVIFIFPSTDLLKFPPAIISRCMVLDFTPIPEPEILSNLENICKELKQTYELNGLKIIAKISCGSARDSLSHLEKCICYGTLTEENISTVLGSVDQSNTFYILKEIMQGNINNALSSIEKLYFLGKDMYSLAQNLVECMRDIFVYTNTKKTDLLAYDEKYVTAFSVEGNQLYHAMNKMYSLLDSIKGADNKKIILEISLMEISTLFSNVKIGSFDSSITNVKDTSKETTPTNPNSELSDNKNDKKIENKTEQKTEVSQESKTVDNQNTNTKPSAINHFKFLSSQALLLNSYDISDKDLKILVDANIYCTIDSFIIKSPNINDLDKAKLKNKMKSICKVDLNIIFAEKKAV